MDFPKECTELPPFSSIYGFPHTESFYIGLVQYYCTPKYMAYLNAKQSSPRSSPWSSPRSSPTLDIPSPWPSPRSSPTLED